MKCSVVRITLNSDAARRAAGNRLCKTEALGITTEAQAVAYQGAEFKENTVDCIDLHVVYRDGFVCVNFINEEGVRINYDYPTQTLVRVKRESNEVQH